MKQIVIIVLSAFLLSASCNDKPKITETAKVNEWVYGIMKDNYLWSNKLPSLAQSGLETPTQEYFDANLRYRSNRAVPYGEDTYGDRFSFIEYTGDGDPTATRASSDVERTYDFGFRSVRVVDHRNGEILFFQVLYVQKGSPADGKLRRGDAFDRVNGKHLTNANIDQIFSSSKLEIELLNRAEGYVTIEIEKDWYWDYPIVVDTIYNNLPRKTAYMLYTHFSGDMSDKHYTPLLREAFGRYKAAGVTDLVLDLRYNGGGLLATAQLLASLIAPQGELGKTFMYTEDNKGRFSEAKLFPNESYPQGNNADIKNLYVITSGNTASASELIIHTLQPIYGDRLRVIGQTTRGKNLGSRPFESDRYDWEISPITVRVHDRNKVSGYEMGKRPDVSIEGGEFAQMSPETSYYYDLMPLGDYEHERLLNFTMSHYFGVPVASFTTYKNTRTAHGAIPIPGIPERGLIMSGAAE